MKACLERVSRLLVFGREMLSSSCPPVLVVFNWVCVKSTKKSQHWCGHIERHLSLENGCFCPLLALQIHSVASWMFSLSCCVQEGIWPVSVPQICLVKAPRIIAIVRTHVAKLSLLLKHSLILFGID